MANVKILIVEDERIVAKGIEKSLKKLDYIVIGSVASGEEAVRKAAETQPDLILMDVRLRGNLDGIEAAEQIRANFDIPVIYLTAYADENTLQRAKLTEPFGYIVKPFDERDLHAAIEVALRRRLSEVAIRVALQKEKELSELKSRFWSMVAHEFRNPMTSILSSAQLLERHNRELPEERRREYLYVIQRSVEAMDQLLNDVLALGKAEGGRLEFRPAPLDLESFCWGLIEELQFTTSSDHHIVFVSQGQCVDVCLDANLLRHILSNLLSNAIKYSPRGGNVYLELSCPNEEAVFQVRDTGIGIPPADQLHMFEAFHRAENVGRIPGTGLGLTMVQKCLELHRGQISVNSELGAGTVFTVKLPLNRDLLVANQPLSH
ncbi:ATP-binding protein [Leptolyngbya sp. FACHB-261]|uniref:hybrid sensor histidine kinase/response regulator n=1 Tax=Leptolyngbya sp. FACHB-261 TaxID=2692806 RepID=UPI0016879CCC|nr:ATP-binding protein [Leptolyngbya sp. FACHB-261]MBD2103039.1 response regulator [Leptolyngbya sp. FACHB-261]